MEKKYTIDEVFDMIGEKYLTKKTDVGRKYNNDKDKDLIVDGYTVRRNSLRYMTFYQKGTACACCGRKGAYFKLESSDPNGNADRRHFNLYSEDGVLMTKDHIIPKSKGGKNDVDNMQTMCIICNEKKADK